MAGSHPVSHTTISTVNHSLRVSAANEYDPGVGRPRKIAKRPGRPPIAVTPITELGRWLRAREMTSATFVELARVKADEAGVDPALVPTARSLTDLAAGRYAPSPVVMLVIRHATDGDVDLQHWVRDLYHDRRDQHVIRPREQS